MFPIYGTPLGRCAAAYYIESSPPYFSDLSGESSYRIFRRKTYPEAQIAGGRIFDYFLKIREYISEIDISLENRQFIRFLTFVMKTKKMRDVRTSLFQAVARRDLCSEAQS